MFRPTLTLICLNFSLLFLVTLQQLLFYFLSTNCNLLFNSLLHLNFFYVILLYFFLFWYSSTVFVIVIFDIFASLKCFLLHNIHQFYFLVQLYLFSHVVQLCFVCILLFLCSFTVVLSFHFVLFHQI